ncbi:MAG: GNAT family N-acetyltransferase [Hyphomicrobiaceae bacterium]
MPVVVVPIAETLIMGFRDVVDAVARERRHIALTKAPPLRLMRKFVLGNLKKDYPHYLALDGDRVVGWSDITPVSDRETFAHRGVLGMGLLADYRGKGIGTALLGRAIAHARRIGFVRVELQVYADNTPAIGLYRKHGFVVEGRLKDAAYLDGQFRDVLQMVNLDRSALESRPRLMRRTSCDRA